MESYSFLALIANITPYGLLETRTFVFEDSVVPWSTYMKSFETFGSFFACGYEICAFIPAISKLAQQRQLEHESCNANISPANFVTYQNLLYNITKWQPPPIDKEMRQWSSEYGAAAEVWKHAVLIYFKASMCGSSIEDPETLEDIQGHIELALKSLHGVGSSPYGTIMMWPGLITGSCLTKDEQRQAMLFRMRFSRFPNLHLAQASRLLELLWADPDKRSFGPYGLFIMMKKHNIVLSIA